MKVNGRTELEALFARQGARRWEIAATGARERIGKLTRLRAAIVARQEELFAAVHDDFRRSPRETWLIELIPTIEEIDFTVRHLAGWMRPRRLPGALVLPLAASWIRYEPKGRVLVISPWNFPFHIAVDALVSAVAAGNCVICKPSNRTPATSAFLASLVGDLFPPEEALVVEGAGAALGDLLLELPFDHVFFTGSSAVGARVGAAALRSHAGLTLEMGGKSPALILAGASLEKAARKIMWGKCLNAGQTCVAPDYLLCPARAVPAFAAEARKAVASFYGETEEARRASPHLARIVDRAGCERLEGLVKDAVDRGARLELGGRFDPAERYAAPTLLTDVTPDMAVMAEEIFGPVLPVMSYESLDDAVGYIRARPKPLALYVFARRARAAQDVVAATTSGSAAVNDLIVQIENLNGPFGGVGMSGSGSYHGFFGFKAFSHERNVMRQGPLALADSFSPPFDARGQDRKSALVSRFLRMRRRGEQRRI
jgi:aldehyde dehydrogenase (NAD+)